MIHSLCVGRKLALWLLTRVVWSSTSSRLTRHIISEKKSENQCYRYEQNSSAIDMSKTKMEMRIQKNDLNISQIINIPVSQKHRYPNWSEHNFQHYRYEQNWIQNIPAYQKSYIEKQLSFYPFANILTALRETMVVSMNWKDCSSIGSWVDDAPFSLSATILPFCINHIESLVTISINIKVRKKWIKCTNSFVNSSYCELIGRLW